jgi:hypothetical protein
VAVPSFKPKHEGCVKLELAKANTAGSVTTTTVVAVQPFAVVAVTVYCCAVKFEKIPVTFDCGPNGAMVYVGEPVADTVMVPLLLPLHNGCVKIALLKVGPTGVAGVIVVVLVQPFTSVTVIMYVTPGAKFDALPVVALIEPDGTVGAILYTFVPLPPVDVTVAVPLLLGTHVGSVVVLIANVNAAGWVIVKLTVPTQAKAFVAVTVYVPAHKPVIAPVMVLKFCPGLIGAMVYVIPGTIVACAVPSH